MLITGGFSLKLLLSKKHVLIIVSSQENTLIIFDAIQFFSKNSGRQSREYRL